MGTKRKQSKKIWVTASTFLIGLILLASVLSMEYTKKMNELRERAHMNAQIRIVALNRNVTRCEDLTNTLELILMDGNDGLMDDFQRTAEALVGDKRYIASLQLAPNGQVEEVYPEEGNQEGKINLFDDEARGPVSTYSRDTGRVTMQGPFELNQGGKGIAVRNPVYLMDDHGEEQFWGFTVGIIKVPDVFSETIAALKSLGYEYALYKTNPLDTDYHLITSSAAKITEPEIATFEEGECVWKLELMPVGGWSVTKDMMLYYVIGGVLLLLFTALVYMVHWLAEDRRMFSEMSYRDPLTGLLNRRSFGDDLRQFKQDGHPCGIMYLDLNRFKEANDTYGHSAGNDVLVAVAERISKAVPYKMYRLGGDEFAILITEELPPEKYEEMMREIHQTIGEPIKSESNLLVTSVSIGYARAPQDANDPDRLRQIADQRMYEDKVRARAVRDS